VLQYAGYSRNLKVAALERKLSKEGRFAEFESLFSERKTRVRDTPRASTSRNSG